jgi:BirA family biotin operon repressor/biotin-[acetyl-CoA-carboxylase] ligase
VQTRQGDPPTRARAALFANEQIARAFAASLGTSWVGARLRYFFEVDSTNSRARRLARTGWPEGTVVVADHQTLGRGRLGRTWICPPRAGLLVSVIVPSTLPRRAASAESGALSPWLTAAGALAMAAAIRRTAECPALIEWPNDIVASGAPGMASRKLGGVLVEPATDSLAVLGIGVNVDIAPAEFSPELSATATSVAEAFGRAVDRRALLGAFLVELERRLEDASGLSAELEDLSATVGREYASDSVRGIAIGIDEQMRLVVELPNGDRSVVPSRTVGESA